MSQIAGTRLDVVEILDVRFGYAIGTEGKIDLGLREQLWMSMVMTDLEDADTGDVAYPAG